MDTHCNHENMGESDAHKVFTPQCNLQFVLYQSFAATRTFKCLKELLVTKLHYQLGSLFTHKTIKHIAFWCKALGYPGTVCLFTM